MNKDKRLALIKSGITGVVGCGLISIINAFTPIINNKISLLQFKNDDILYTFYKLYGQYSGLANVVIFIITFALIIMFIMKGFKNKEEMKNE